MASVDTVLGTATPGAALRVSVAFGTGMPEDAATSVIVTGCANAWAM
jgi:hypothetical protein